MTFRGIIYGLLLLIVAAGAIGSYDLYRKDEEEDDDGD